MFRMLARIALVASLAASLVIFHPAPSMASPHSFRIVNSGDHTIKNVYISEVNWTSWGRDQLGRSVLEPGDDYSWEWDGNCYQDIRIRYTNDHVVTWRNYDTCAYDLRSNY